SKALPPGVYRLAHELDSGDMELAAHAWMIGSYHFDTYLPQRPDFEAPQLVLPKESRLDRIQALGEAVFLVRDLINTPAADMGPVELELAARN
ncbi:MAG TPA: leucyl aminopeptidase, partial [Rhodobiaceae bacterium]|nr:leucyl aminopeptidase [Rhodobiaceae bacterium]